jgi:hypothetical protein
LKKVFNIICLFALLLTTSSLSYFYWVEEKLHEKEVFAAINVGEAVGSDQAHQIKLILKNKEVLPKGFEWEEEGSEFSYKGMFYDIISLEKTTKGWLLTAASDEEEAMIVAKQVDHSKQSVFKLAKIQLIFIAPLSYQEKGVTLVTNINFTDYTVNILQLSINKYSPPPEAI